MRILHQVMEEELRVEKEIQIQEVVDEDTVVVCISANTDGDHVNEEKQQQEIERDTNNNNENGDNHGDGAYDNVDKKDPAKVK